MKSKIRELSISKNESDRRECLALLQNHLAENPDDLESWYDKASCHDFLGEEREAEPCYRQCYNLGWQKLPKNEHQSFFIGFGSTLRNNQHYEEAISVLIEAISLFPTYLPLKVFLALAYYSNKNDKRAAETLFDVCLKMSGKEFDGYERAIQWYVERLQDYPEAR